MKQRPIIFNTEMVRAIVDGRKTQTRRPAKNISFSENGGFVAEVGGKIWMHGLGFDHQGTMQNILKSKYGPNVFKGDQLWVRETFADCGPRLTYKADDDGAHCVVKRWTPSIHMPRSAARIILEVTDVRVERLKDIKEQDAIAEGMTFTNYGLNQFGNQQPGWLWRKSNKHEECLSSAKWAFSNLWESIYGDGSWSFNPFVWVIEFKVISTTGGAA